MSETGQKCPRQALKMSETRQKCPRQTLKMSETMIFPRRNLLLKLENHRLLKKRSLAELREQGIIEREGGDFGGHWVICRKRH